MAMMSSGRITAALSAAVIVLAGSMVPFSPATAAEIPPAAAPAPDPEAARFAELPTLTYDDVAAWAEVLVDGDDVERDAEGVPFNTFGGFGSVSCNNTSNLLLDYKEEQPEVYWRIMHLLFDPETGAGLKHIKVELGADNNTSSGAEPATKRSADEPANVLRGAGFHFIADAQSINPDIEVEALRWGEPSWTQGNSDLRYQWYKETIDAAYDTYGVEFDYLSPSQNEVHANYINSELAWTVDFAERLERDAEAEGARYDYSRIKMVALDSYRNVGAVSRAILASPGALEQVDAVGYHYDISGDASLTRLNKEYGMEVLYSEGVSPMIEPEYRINADPARGGIGGTVGAVDIADRFINAYRWSGSDPDPAHMTTFLFQPAVSAMYEGSQYSPKNLIRASDPWSGYYEGGVGLTMVRHFMQFIEEGWEYVEGASYGDGTKGDGGTNVDSSTRTYLTLRTPEAEVAAGADAEFSQVHANNTRTQRNFEVKVANLDSGADTPLAVWETRGPDAGEGVDANYFQNIGKVVPVRTETVDGVEYQVYRVQVQPYSIVTLSTLPDGVHGSTEPYTPGEYVSPASDSILPLPYTDDYEYDGYGLESVNGVEMDYVERRGGSPRYTADQNGAFEVVTGETERGNVMQQRIHADNRGYTWNVWGDGSQRNPSTAEPATVLGDHSWTNYTASVDFRLDGVVRDASLENFVGVGVRQVVAEGSDLASYSARVYDDGRWELRKLGTTVASGSVFLFDPDQWHTLDVEARENVISVTLDGERLGSYADTTGNPTMAGRISLSSGYYNTSFDNLAVTPIEGLSWASEKVDDADSRITYPNGFSFTQAGYAHLNRTQHVLSAGRSAAFDMTGTGFNLLGATGTASLSIVVDDDPPRAVSVGGTGNRQTSYWLRGLTDGAHRVTVTVVSGTFVLDGVDVVRGGSVAEPVEPERKPISIVSQPSRLTARVGTVPDLPETVRATSQTGGQIDAPVTWTATPAQFATAYDMVKVDGVFTDNPALAVSAYVEVVPEGLRYFVDANAPADAVAYPAVRVASGDELRNGAADGVFTTESGWGRVGTYNGKGRLNLNPYDKTRETGWYSSGPNVPVVYRFTLPAGEYQVASGHTEWWNPGANRSRRATTTIQYTDAGGAAVTVPVGTHTFTSGAINTTAVLRGGFTLAEETVVTFSVSGAGGTEAPALSWVAINDAPAQSVDRTALAEQLALTQESPRRAYTAESWQNLREVGLAGKAVNDDPAATQQEVDAATAALSAARDALVEVAYQPLEDYRIAVEQGDAAELPATVTLATLSGVQQQVPVTWNGTPATDTAYAVSIVTGNAGGTTVTLAVEVVPEELVYFVDAAGVKGDNADNAGINSPSYAAVRALEQGELRNEVADRRFDEASGWGLVNPVDSGAGFVGAKGRVAGTYDKYATTGWWASAGSSIDYRLTLPAGQYELTSGYREWWGVTRQVVPSVTVGDEVVTGTPVSLSGASPRGSSTLVFTVDVEQTVLFRAARGAGTADPVLSWFAVADVTPATAPEAPNGVSALLTGMDVRVSWSTPADDGGSPVTGYRVYAIDGETALCEVPAAETACTVTGVEPGATASFVVTALNALGEGARSAASAPVAVPEVPQNDGAFRAPGTPVLSSNDGHDTGLKDGTFQLTMDMWWGDNGGLFKLYRDGELVAKVPLASASPMAQRKVIEVAALANGTYEFVGVLVNSKGSTESRPLTVTVTDASPGLPVLSNDNWSGGGAYTVTANLWWGTNATSYRFLENGVEVAAGELTAATPGAQKATLSVTGKPRGEYLYTVEFRNAAGATTTAPHRVVVRK
ncbi:fibronectin type III domain-containing protein [Microbacterium sp. P05]|uniref:fibronectin type III domain-containing protein n=1 Tax=Microbacterium sp. P05 TaxID=3366948 RepID=UPI003745C013